MIFVCLDDCQRIAGHAAMCSPSLGWLSIAVASRLRVSALYDYHTTVLQNIDYRYRGAKRGE